MKIPSFINLKGLCALLGINYSHAYNERLKSEDFLLLRNTVELLKQFEKQIAEEIELNKE